MVNEMKEKRIKIMIETWKLFVKKSKLDRSRRDLQMKFRSEKLESKMFKRWKLAYNEITRIKKDRFLRQALIDGDEFFEIQVCKTQSGISELLFA